MGGKKFFRKVKDSIYFDIVSSNEIKSDLQLIKEYSEEVEKELEEEIKDMYIDDFFKLYNFVLSS